MSGIAVAGATRRVTLGATRRALVGLLVLGAIIGCGHPSVGGGDASGGGDDSGNVGSDGGNTGSDSGTGSDGGGGGGTGSDGGGTGSDGGVGMDAGSGSGMDAAGPGACGLAVCAKSFSSGTKGAALAVAVDSADNVYIAGLAESDLTFGTHTMFQLGSRDAFVVSFAADGTWRWGKRWGHSTTLVGAYGIAVDANSNIFIVGGMTGAIDFGGGYVGSGNGMFAASFDTNGNYRWARADGGGSGLLGVATYGGTVYGIGRFLNTVTFSPTISLTSAGAEDVVVAAFATSDGAVSWARRIGTAATDYEGGIVARAGAIAFTMTSGAVGSGEKLVSWTAAGADRWSVSLPAALDLRGLAVDPNANLYVSGLHTGGTDVPPNATYSSGDNEYVHAYADGGASTWSWTLPETPAHTWTAIPYTPSAWNPAHELVLAGTYDGTLATGSASLTSGNDTIFLASFTTSGTPVASRKLDDASTTATEWVHGVAIDSHGTTWVVGQYYGTPNFGDGALPFASQGGVLVLRLAP